MFSPAPVPTLLPKQWTQVLDKSAKPRVKFNDTVFSCPTATFLTSHSLRYLHVFKEATETYLATVNKEVNVVPQGAGAGFPYSKLPTCQHGRGCVSAL